jgi:nitroreductase
VEGNQRWARAAPVLVASVAQLNFDKTGKPNRHAFHDVGLAVQNMVVQATALGLLVHQMAGFSGEKVREIYGVPDGFEPVAAMAIGYGLAKDELPEPFREFDLGARSRKPLSAFVFEERWGETSRLVSE